MYANSLTRNLLKTSKRSYTSATHILNPGISRTQSVSVCPGEGVGPQIVDSVLEIFEHLNVPLNVKMVEYASLKRGKANSSLRENKNLLLGPISNKMFEERDKGVCHQQILKELDIFASVLNAISIPGVDIQGKDIDTLIIKQACDGFGVECKKARQEKYKKLAQYALNNALMSSRGKIHAFHNANMDNPHHEDFLIEMRKMAERNSGIGYEELYLADGAIELIKHMEDFELIVTPSNCGLGTASIAMSIVGGHQLVPSIHIGDEYSIFEQGGNKPEEDKVKDNSANPTGLILSATMMLRQANLPCYSDLIERAIFATYEDSEVRTPDLGGNYSTQEFTNKVMSNIETKSTFRAGQVQEEKLAIEF
ncbi:unnamed protein product [Moneuplotes crassus]|uniref:Isopropylmalate dehydrogenase-like domain-containing protein n=1 Tax=Euplotes crassus TaxID=5936 RepID=A0AAD1UEN6_EUPCR|nr:unnamed protein product [Moneuplotes crassus]